MIVSNGMHESNACCCNNTRFLFFGQYPFSEMDTPAKIFRKRAKMIDELDCTLRGLHACQEADAVLVLYQLVVDIRDGARPIGDCYTDDFCDALRKYGRGAYRDLRDQPRPEATPAYLAAVLFALLERADVLRRETNGHAPTVRAYLTQVDQFVAMITGRLRHLGTRYDHGLIVPIRE